MAGGGRSQRPGFLDFLGVEAPSGNDLNVLPTKDIIDKWIVDNPGKEVPDPSRPKSLPLHRKEVLASFQYIKFLACVKAKVPALYERLRDAYRWLHDPTIYEEAFRNRPSQARDRSSRVRLPDADIASWIADGKKKKEGSEAKTCVSDLAPLLNGTTARNEMKVKRGEGGGHAQSNVPTSLDVL